MKEIYEKPVCEVVLFDTEDIITASGDYGLGNGQGIELGDDFVTRP